MPKTDLLNPVSLDVYAGEKKVGTLAELPDHRIAFEYDKDWLKDGFSISPFSLPLNPGVFIPKTYGPLDGLFGVFADSLPDGWGALLTDRFLRSYNIDPISLTPLQRLSLVGSSGKSLLEYRPSTYLQESFSALSFDELAEECAKVLADKPSDRLDTLYEMCGSSGGARPKVNTEIDGHEWIVKFPASFDPVFIGEEEYRYFLCAKECGITVPEFCLFPSEKLSGYFGCQRFDRNEKGKVYMISAGALLETSYRIPNLDYEILLKLTWLLTGNMDEVRKVFRLACFNVFSHNRDDHAKNFSFLYQDGQWQLSPAYDLTWSSSFGGEHATTVHGNGKNPRAADLEIAALSIGLSIREAQSIIQSVQKTVHQDLKDILVSHSHH